MQQGNDNDARIAGSLGYESEHAALLAAPRWASRIVLNRLVGARPPGLQAPATATSVSALLGLPVAVTMCSAGRPVRR